MKPPELVVDGALTTEGRAVVIWLTKVYPDTLNVKPENVVDTARRDFYDRVLNGDLSAAAFFSKYPDTTKRLAVEYTRTIPFLVPSKESVDAPSIDDEPLTEALTFPDGRLTPAGMVKAKELAVCYRALPRGAAPTIERYGALVIDRHIHSPAGFFASYPAATRELCEDIRQIEALIDLKQVQAKLVAAAAQLSGE